MQLSVLLSFSCLFCVGHLVPPSGEIRYENDIPSKSLVICYNTFLASIQQEQKGRL